MIFASKYYDHRNWWNDNVALCAVYWWKSAPAVMMRWLQLNGTPNMVT